MESVSKTVHSSAYMFCAGVFIQLALACAWVNGSSTANIKMKILCMFYGKVIQNSLFFWVQVLCLSVKITSTSLCLGVWLISSYDLNENIMPVNGEVIPNRSYFQVHVLCWCDLLTSTSMPVLG